MTEVHFGEPVKRIDEEADIIDFRRSVAYERLHKVIIYLLSKVRGLAVPSGQLNSAIVTKGESYESLHDIPLSFQQPSFTESDICRKILGILSRFDSLIDETPPLKGPRRFGNMACRDWHEKMNKEATLLLATLTKNESLVKELHHYLCNSFGSSVRLDYGSGHELSFIAFIGGLLTQKVIGDDMTGQEFLVVFSKYYDLVRRLILDYNLEPAGSHGVWGLDDHFHFIYILGAAEFNLSREKDTTDGKHKPITQYIPPVSQVLSPQTIAAYKTTNLYVNAIAFIYKLKQGPFHEHSPVLFDIQKSVISWSKVETGLLKMYEVEVFSKFPVIQHFWFGEGLFPWKNSHTLQDLPVKKLEEKNETASKANKDMPGLINGFQGQRTTKTNITLTGAPWARAGTARNYPIQSDWTGKNKKQERRPQ